MSTAGAVRKGPVARGPAAGLDLPGEIDHLPDQDLPAELRVTAIGVTQPRRHMIVLRRSATAVAAACSLQPTAAVPTARSAR